MAFKKIAGVRKYYKYKDCTPGQRLVDDGEYTGSEEGKFGIQHLFTQRNGEVVCLNSAGHLNYLLKEHVKVGQRVHIDYADRKVLAKGTFAGKEAHTFDLSVDDAPVAQTAESAAAAVPSADGDISL